MFLHRTVDGVTHIGICNHGCTLAEFVELFPSYSLDQKYVSREYWPGEKHILKSAVGMESGPMPWTEGDKYIEHAEDIGAILTAKRHGENWKKAVAETNDQVYKMKLQAKLQAAQDAAARLK